MKESEEKFRLIMELANDGIIILQDGKIKQSNYYMAKMCGYTLEEMLDTAFASFFHSRNIPTVESIFEPVLKDDNALEMHEVTLMCKNGHKIEVEITAGQFTYQGKPAILLIIRDISERNKTKHELEKARTLDSIAALSGGIAHDYNNLLTAIIGNISLAQTYLDPDAKAFMLLSQAQTASEVAKSLTQKLITFSKGGLPVKRITEVAKLIRSAIEFTLSGSNLKCKFSFAEELWPVEVDQTQIGQAIHNVVMNAREAMPQGGFLTVGAENIYFSKDFHNLKGGNFVKISIADQGNGILDENIEKIFDPYFSTKKIGTKKGTGLGLSICRSIIRKHGGEVVVESEIGLGTTFQIYLPAAKIDTLEKRSFKHGDKERPIFGEGRILVMDDEEMIRDLAAGILTYLGYEVDFAQDGAEAIAKYKEAMATAKPFDAVILDLTVRGGTGGKESIRELIEIDPNVTAIVSSGYSADPGITDFRQYGFSGVVTKPYSMQEMGEKLNQVMEHRHNKNISEIK